jgi:hypothetical protein
MCKVYTCVQAIGTCRHTGTSLFIVVLVELMGYLKKSYFVIVL